VSEAFEAVIVGAGAAGLMAGAWAVRTRPGARVLLLDGASKIGAKILVAGGGRCNVTHDVVDETAYAGSSRNAIRKVLLQFGVEKTVQFFRELGVELKREETGKLFPVTDDAHTVLRALLDTVRRGIDGHGAEIRHPARVTDVRRRESGGFVVRVGDAANEIVAQRVILATGGMSLPKSGSDGFGFTIAKSLGHTITRDVFPGLVPLVIRKGHWLTELSGVTIDAELSVHSAKGQKLSSFANSTLITHFGLSGPSVLDVSRYWTYEVLTAAREGRGTPSLRINWIPGETVQGLDEAMVGMGRQSPVSWIQSRSKGSIPERLASALVARANVPQGATGASLTREQRRALATLVAAMEVPISGDRGYNFAEVTAGGVPLSELHLATMESRVCPGLHLCGEICDVDGRVGGYNFQWAWASGYLAGRAAAGV